MEHTYDKKGNASIAMLLVGAGVTILTSLIGAYATAAGSIASVDNRVTAVTVTENLHYSEVQKALERIEKKLDSAASIRSAATISQ